MFEIVEIAEAAEAAHFTVVCSKFAPSDSDAKFDIGAERFGAEARLAKVCLVLFNAGDEKYFYFFYCVTSLTELLKFSTTTKRNKCVDGFPKLFSC